MQSNLTQKNYFLAVSLILVFFVFSIYFLNREPAEVGQVIGSETFLNDKGEIVVKYAFVSGSMDIAVSDNVVESAKEKEIEVIAEDLEARTSSNRTFVTNDPNIKISEFVWNNKNEYVSNLLR